MRLLADSSDLPRKRYVGTVAIGSTPRIARQASRRAIGPREDHPAVNATGQGHTDRILPAKIAGKNTLPGCLELFVIVCRAEPRQRLPLLAFEIGALLN